MNQYIISFTGRLKDAIGIVYKITTSVEAATSYDAINKLYDKYEHISNPKIKRVEIIRN